MSTRYFLLFLAAASVSPLLFAQAGSVSSPSSREALISSLAQRAAERTGETVAVAVPIDPFYPPSENLVWEVPVTETAVVATVSDEDLVPRLIAEIRPTGSGTERGGVPVLVFGERRQKIGDKLIVSLEGIEYAVEIVSITGNRFRIRFNGHEAERPIK